jgi:hypothetical protein
MQWKRLWIPALSAAIVACAASGAQRKTIENHPGGGDGGGLSGMAGGVLPVGAYACSFESDGYQYPPFPCAVSMHGRDTWLEKTGGSQRIRGTITAIGGGFHFDGEYFCPWGDCTSKTSGDFHAAGVNTWEGRVGSDGGDVVVRLVYLPGGAVGGGMYGGSMYGGGMYGGGMYGGGAYGGGMPRPEPPEIDDPI